MKKVLGLACVVLLAYAGTAGAVLSFRIGPGFNLFSDSRIEGLNTSFEVSYDIGDFIAGYKVEQSNLTVKDAQASANNFQLANQLNLLCVQKKIASPMDMPVSIGLEFGSIQITPLAGSVAAAAGLAQVKPVVGILGGIDYESKGKYVSTSLFVNVGYRFIDLVDIAVPAGFTAGGANFKDLNAIKIDLGMAIKF